MRYRKAKKDVFLIAKIKGDVSHQGQIYTSALKAHETLETNRFVFEKLNDQLQIMEEKRLSRVLAVSNESLKALKRIKERQRRKPDLSLSIFIITQIK